MHERNHFPATAKKKNKRNSDLNSMYVLVIYTFSCTLLTYDSFKYTPSPN